MKTQRFIKILLIPVFLLIYYLIVRKTGFGIPCIIHLVTGFNCPGCGVSRMLIALLNLDFMSAFKANRVVFIMLPLIIALFSYVSWLYVTGKKPSKTAKITENILLSVMITVLIIWGVVRNILKM